MQRANSIHRWSLALLAAVLVVALPAAAFACPTCKDQLASDTNNSSIVTGYFWSILLMLSAPLVILGSLGAYVYYQLSKADSQLPPLPAAKAATVESSQEEREAVGV